MSDIDINQTVESSEMVALLNASPNRQSWVELLTPE